jgi:hypothetical protein
MGPKKKTTAASKAVAVKSKVWNYHTLIPRDVKHVCASPPSLWRA